MGRNNQTQVQTSPTAGAAGSLPQLLSEYYGEPIQPGILESIMDNKTNRLLGALVVETRAMRMAQGTDDIDDILSDVDLSTPEDDREGLYASVNLELRPGDWQEIDLDFTTSEVDLRQFESPIEVAFADETRSSNRIQYFEDETPVVGVPVKTSEIHLRVLDGGEDTQISVQAWSDDYR